MTEIMTRGRLIIWLEEMAFIDAEEGNQTFQILEDSKDDEVTVCFKVKPKETYCEMAFRKMIESFGVTLVQAEASMIPEYWDLNHPKRQEYNACLNGEDYDYLRTMINEIYKAGKEVGFRNVIASTAKHEHIYENKGV